MEDFNYDELEFLEDEETSLYSRIGGRAIDEYTGVNAEVSTSNYGEELEDLRRLDLDDASLSNGYVAMSTFIAMMKVQGKSNKDIMQKMDINGRQLQFIINSGLYKDIMLAMTANIVENSKMFLVSASLKATSTMIELMNSSNEKIDSWHLRTC